MLIVTWNALGFFTGSENVFPFSADLSDVCRSFIEESNTTSKIERNHDVLFIKKLHNVNEKKQFA